MLSPEEKRFIRQWEDQRTGGRTFYIILYTFTWSFIIFLAPLVVSVFIDIYSFFQLDRLPLWLAILIALIAGFIVSSRQWRKNEAKWRSLLEREASTDHSIY